MPTVEELNNYYRDTFEHIQGVQFFMSRVINVLMKRSLHHDGSKFSEEESQTYAKVIPMFKGKTYGTPEHDEVSAMLGDAWKHHLSLNDHHTGHYKNGINDMNLLAIIEMICDWKSASERDPLQDFSETCRENCAKYGADEQLTKIIMTTARELGMFF